MHAAIEFRVRFFAQLLRGLRAHPGHYAHAQDDVDGVGNLVADFGQRRLRRAHDVGHDKHGAPAHRALQHPMQFAVGFSRVGPMIGRAGFFFRRGADEGELFHPRDVVRVGAMQVTTGRFLLVEFDHDFLAAGFA